MMDPVVPAAIVMLVAVGLMLLQIFLSKRDSKYPGLIMPIVFLLISFIYLFNMAGPADGTAGDFIISLLITLVTGNIPTFITLGIYFLCRKELKENN